MPVDRKKMAQFLESPEYKRMNPQQQEAIKGRLRQELNGEPRPEGSNRFYSVGGPTQGQIGRGIAATMGQSLEEGAVDALPQVGGSIGGYGGGAAATLLTPFLGPFEAAAVPAGDVAGSAAGGAGGAWLRDYFRKKIGLPPIGDVSGAATEQGVISGIGGIIGTPLRAAARRFLSPEMKAVEEAAGRTKLNAPLIADSPKGFMGAPGPVGSYLRDESERLPLTSEITKINYKNRLKEATDLASRQIDTHLGPSVAPEVAGERIADFVKGTGKSVYRDEVKRLSDDVSLLLGPLDVDVTRLKIAARDLIKKEIIPLRNVAKNIGKPDREAQSILSDFIRMPEKVKFNTLRDLRTKLMDMANTTSEHGVTMVSPQGRATAKMMVKKITELLDQKAAVSGGGPAWQAFRDFTKEGAGIYYSSYIKQILNAHPEKIVKGVQLGDVTRAKLLRDAVLFGERSRLVSGRMVPLASQAERMQAREAWRNFQENFIRGKLLAEPEAAGALKVGSLSNNLKKAGDAQLQAIFGTDAAGRMALRNLRDIATVVDNIHVPVQLGLRGAWAAPLGAMAIPFTKIIYSPSLSRAYISILKRLPQQPGLAANLIRLYNIADRQNEISQQRKEARGEQIPQSQEGSQQANQ